MQPGPNWEGQFFFVCVCVFFFFFFGGGGSVFFFCRFSWENLHFLYMFIGFGPFSLFFLGNLHSNYILIGKRSLPLVRRREKERGEPARGPIFFWTFVFFGLLVSWLCFVAETE